MKEEIRKAISDLIYTPDAKPRTTFVDGSPLETKLALIDETVTRVLKIINNPQRKLYCGWMVEDAEHMFRQMQVDEGRFPDVEYTDELGEEIMDLVERRFDASYGVAWDSIESAIEEVMERYES
jgi:hypothetical protein